MKWSEKYLTGIKRIDDHQKALFEMSEAFRDALIERRGERVFGGLLDSLGAYAGAHFGFEEGCMGLHLRMQVRLRPPLRHKSHRCFARAVRCVRGRHLINVRAPGRFQL